MSWYKRRISLLVLALMFCNLPLANAQVASTTDNLAAVQQPQNNNQTNSTDQNNQNNQTDNKTPIQPITPRVQLPTTRTGIDPSKSINLALRDAVTMALEHNLNIQVEKENIRIAEFNLEGSKGVYDPVVGAGFNYNRQTIPSANPFRTGVGSNSFTEQSVNPTVNASKLFSVGSLVSTDFGFFRQTSSSNNAGLSPAYAPQFNLALTQPLLRGFRVNANERNIRSLQKQLDLSDLTFRQRLITLIAQVQTAYYNLVFAIDNAEIQRQSVELAAVQLRNNEIQVRAGTAAPIDIVSAQAELERRKDAAIAALLPITQAENSLKTLLLDDPTSDVWNARIVPTDQVDVGRNDMDLSSAISTALDRRPEIKQLQLQGELNEIDLEFFKNQLKPQVDLNARFSAQGLGGQPVIVPGQPPISPTFPFRGGLGTSLSNLFDFRTYQVGVTFSFPLHNRTAKANMGRTLAQGRQIDNNKRLMVQTIIADVRNAVQAVESSRQRVEAAEAAVEAAQAQLKGEEQKFSAGLSTNFLVLTRQNDLSIARGNLLRAKTDYSIARADLQRVMANNIP